MTNLISVLSETARYLPGLLPTLLLVCLNAALNLHRDRRPKQYLMPLMALLFTLFSFGMIWKANALTSAVLTDTAGICAGLGRLLGKTGVAFFNRLGTFLTDRLAVAIDERALARNNPMYLWTGSFLFAAIYLLVKAMCIRIFARMQTGGLYENIRDRFYEVDADTKEICLRKDAEQLHNYACLLYYAALTISFLFAAYSQYMVAHNQLVLAVYPFLPVLTIGECYFYLDGNRHKEKAEDNLSGEYDQGFNQANYSLLRQPLKRLFADRLLAENTSIGGRVFNNQTADALLVRLERSGDAALVSYAGFMRRKMMEGLNLEQDYLISGADLIRGKSILFNNPFYHDLAPYIFYAMNRMLLQHRKVLIILGRHRTEDNIAEWCREGLAQVTGIPTLWEVSVLSSDESMPDVGIMTRSCVHDLGFHAANEKFLSQAGYVVIVEPSHLLTTAQLGLYSVVTRCGKKSRPVYCSIDKNCDGLLDSLSHILMTSISEVSATGRYSKVSTYMCWDVNNEHLQHRLLPNLARYLGMGTELSFVALKNQISQTFWYGGDAFPVTDMRWIVKQYYHELLNYANLTGVQENMDDYLVMQADNWSARRQKYSFITVEDESWNMFEMKRLFATRATEQSFVNVLSSAYLLKDYMAANDGIFNADPKAIPYLAPDYAHTFRNVILRICLRMSIHEIPEADLLRELELLGIKNNNVIERFWHYICLFYTSADKIAKNEHGEEILVYQTGRNPIIFTKYLIEKKRRFSVVSGKNENYYCISDDRFKTMFLGDLFSATYVAENEYGESQYLGAELIGHIFQKYLPGQFFVFDGKYYEMLQLTASGEMLVRRAAEHISGRVSYRQVRAYTISRIVESKKMGAVRKVSGMQITRQFADLAVETRAYWEMKDYNNFETGRKVEIDGIPVRRYHEKQILRIDLPRFRDDMSAITTTMVMMFNEVFRTLFAENQPYIVAVKPGEAVLPNTCSLDLGNAAETTDATMFVLEDSELDLGLLLSVNRNLDRIFSIICDYLYWNDEEIRKSDLPEAAHEKPDYTVPGADKAPEDAQNGTAAGTPETAGKKERKNKGGKIGGLLGKHGKSQTTAAAAGAAENADHTEKTEGGV